MTTNQLEELDDLLAQAEDTAKGQEGELITKARGIINDYRKLPPATEDAIVWLAEKLVNYLEEGHINVYFHNGKGRMGFNEDFKHLKRLIKHL